MRFNSPIFWIFLAAVVAVLLLLPQRLRKWWLLIASYAFYASWHWPYLGLLIGSATFTYFAANWIDRATGPERKRRGWLAVMVNFLVLFAFKYLDWALGNVDAVNAWFGLYGPMGRFGWLLPLGISFYLFESTSYIFDVVKKREKVHGFWDIQLFIAFFPKLIAGPILRAKEFLPQLTGDLAPKALDARDGFSLVVSGLFMKIVLADGIAPAVDTAFAVDVDALSSTDVVVMALAFGMQIYLDFASYSRIALGAARLCGVQLVENFNFPFSARSPAEFWDRWHISLSKWIRDYIYYPLVGGRVTLGNMCRATIIAMTICGVWHGAGWKYVAWGFYHGLLIAGYHVYRFATRKLAPAPAIALWGHTKAALSVLLLTVILLPSWLLFRASDLTHALRLTGVMLTPWENAARALPGNLYLHVAVLLSAIWIAPFCSRALQFVGPDFEPAPATTRRPWFALASGAALGVLFCFCLVFLRGKTTFIYFQF